MSITYQEEQYLLEHNQLSMLDPPQDQECDLLTVSQYAYLNGVHRHTVLNWIRSGKVSYVPRTHGSYIRYYIPSDTIPPLVRLNLID